MYLRGRQQVKELNSTQLIFAMLILCNHSFIHLLGKKIEETDVSASGEPATTQKAHSEKALACF